jgi:cytoskeletal protein RodZ
MMTGMRWRIGYSLVWLAATCLAVALSWLGVRSVLQASVFSTPVVVSVAAAPTPATSVSPSAPASATARATASSPASTPAASASASSSPAAAADIHDYTTAGGTAVLEVTATSVRFISAKANAGYTAQEAYGTDWLQVDFLTGNGAHGWDVVASWYLHAPTIQIAQF